MPLLAPDGSHGKPPFISQDNSRREIIFHCGILGIHNASPEFTDHFRVGCQ